MNRATHCRQSRHGASMVETAVVLPILFLLLFGIFEYGRLLMVRNLLANAAREGARFAVVHSSDKTTADVQNVVQNYLANQQSQLGNLLVQVYATDQSGNPLNGVSWTNAPFGSGIGVQIDGDFQPVTPVLLLMPNSTHLQSVAVMNSEGD